METKYDKINGQEVLKKGKFIGEKLWGECQITFYKDYDKEIIDFRVQGYFYADKFIHGLKEIYGSKVCGMADPDDMMSEEHVGHFINYKLIHGKKVMYSDYNRKGKIMEERGYFNENEEMIGHGTQIEYDSDRTEKVACLSKGEFKNSKLHGKGQRKLMFGVSENIKEIIHRGTFDKDLLVNGTTVKFYKNKRITQETVSIKWRKYLNAIVEISLIGGKEAMGRLVKIEDNNSIWLKNGAFDTFIPIDSIVKIQCLKKAGNR